MPRTTLQMTPKQQVFVDRYLVHLNATKAAEEAQYKNPNDLGWRLLQKPHIQAAIQLGRARMAARNEVDQDWVLSRLKKNVERCMQEAPVLDSSGKPTGEYAYNASAANRALELLGKHLGMFAERNINFDLTQCTDEQIARIAAGEDPMVVMATSAPPPARPVAN